MSSEVGTGHISIFPVLTGFKSKVSKETQSAGAAGAKTFEGGFKGVGARSGRALGKDLKSALNASAGNLGADSMKKLTSEVASASAALARVRLKQQDDAGRVRVAETRLAEAVAKSGASSSQAVAAEERLASARRTLAATTGLVTSASDRLKSAQASLGAAQSAATQQTSSSFARLRAAASSGLQGIAGVARSAAASISASLSSGFRAAQTTAGIALTAITAKVASLVPGALTASDAIDKFKGTLSFAGLDASKITQLTKSTQDYADRTVYSLSDIQGVTAQLAANSVKDYDRLAEAAGNLNAVAGGNAATFKSVGMVLTQTAGQGKLTTENWNQLADAIPGASGKLQAALQEAGAYTGNFREAMEKGEISAEEFNAAIMKLGLTDVAAEAAKSTKTFEGAIGSLNASITGGLVKVIAPLKPMITGVLSGIANVATAFFDKVAAGVEGVVALLGRGDFTSAFRKAFGVSEDSPVVDFLLRARDAVIGFTSSLPSLTSLIAPLTAGFVALGSGGIASILTRIPMLGGMLGGLAGPLAALGGPVGVLVAGFAGLALSGGDVGAVVGSLTGVITQVVAALPGLISQVATFVPQLVSSILAQIPALLQAAVGIVTVLVEGIVTAIPLLVDGALALITGLVQAIVANLPMIIAGAISLVMALIQGIITALPLLVTAAVQLLAGLLTAIVSALPMIIQGGVQLLMALVTGIIQALPVILQAAIDLVLQWTQAVVASLPSIIEAGIQMLLALLDGLIAMLPDLITMAITLVLQLVSGLISQLPQLIAAGITLVVALVTGLLKAIPEILKSLPEIVKAIWDGLANVDWLGLGAEIIQGIIDGFFSMVGAVGDAIGSVLGGILDFFPHSPAKKGPLSAPGWHRIGDAGGATMDHYIAGAKARAGSFGDALSDVAHAASASASIAVRASVADPSSASTRSRRDGAGETNITVQALPGMSPQEQAELIASQLRWM